MVGDDLAESVVRDRLTQHDWNYGFIIDGFPRNRRQAEFFLESYDIDGVIVLDLPDGQVRRRVLNRRLCGNCGMDYNLIANSPAVPGQCDMCGGELVAREDDTEEALAVRLREYHQQTESVLEIFRRKEYVFVVDARPAPEIVQEQIRKCLGLPPYKGQAADKGEGQPGRPAGIGSCVRSRSSAAWRTRRWPPRSARTWACRSIRCGSPGSRNEKGLAPGTGSSAGQLPGDRDVFLIPRPRAGAAPSQENLVELLKC